MEGGRIRWKVAETVGVEIKADNLAVVPQIGTGSTGLWDLVLCTG